MVLISLQCDVSCIRRAVVTIIYWHFDGLSCTLLALNHQTILFLFLLNKDRISWIMNVLKRKCRPFDEIFISVCVESCQNGNYRWSQWRKYGNAIFIQFSSLTVPCQFPLQPVTKRSPNQNGDISNSLYCMAGWLEWGSPAPAVWVYYQIRKVAGCASAGKAGNVFPATDFKGNR